MDQKTLGLALQKMLVKLAVQRAVKAAVARFSWLGWPVINPIFSYYVGQVITWAAEETELGVARLWVQLVIGVDVRSVDEGVRELQALLGDPKKYTAEQAAKIEANFDDTAADLIRANSKRS